MNIIRVFRMIFILSFICVLMGSPMEAQAQDIAGTISGSVKDTNGNPIEGVGVLISSDSYFGGTCSDGDGNYSFNDLPEDNYNLSASTNSFYCSPATEAANYAQEFWPESSFPNGEEAVSLSVENPTKNNVNFTLSPGGSISGKIYDTDHNPITGVSIGIALNLENYSSPTEIYTCTNPATGEYELKHIPLNVNYKLAANVFPCGPGNHFATVNAWPDSPVNSGGETLTTTITNPNLDNINFTLNLAGTISGSVKDTNGNPIEGVGVIISSDSYFDGICSDNDGNYSFNNLPEDSYNLSASTNSFYCSPATEAANYAQEFWPESSFPNGAEVVTLNAVNPTENNINFTLSPGGSISGKIYDTDHNPITGVSIGIALNLEDYSSPTEIYTCTNPATGEYELKHIPLNVNYKLAANVFPCGPENSFALVYAWPDSPINKGGAMLTLTTLSPDLGNINFTLTLGGSISGKIYDTDHNPITGMSIGIALNLEDYSSPAEIYTCTNPDTGEYELKHIPLNVTYKVAANVFPCGPENPFAPVNAWPDSPINSGGVTLTFTESNPALSYIDFYLHQLGDTPAGNDVLTFTSNGFITYQGVSVSGTTTVESILSDPPQAPSNFEVLGDFYEVSTTAAFTSAQVCFNYADTGEESTIRLLHYENSVWVDVTDNGYPDTQDNVICGTVSSFSPFVIARKLPFSFNGFFQPIDNLPTLNLIKAGSAIPVKFSLGGDQGLNIFYTDYPKSQQIGCDSSAPVDGIEETVSAGSSGLSYSPTTDTYIYVWKTDKAWAGTCRTLVVKLIDGTYHRANFKFK